MDSLLQELTARLPELEWKIETLGACFSARSLPYGLFRPRLEMTAATCMDEIKADIETLATQKNATSSHYLAKRIHQKIGVLVTLCQLQAHKPKLEQKIRFGINSISTRQQWLQSLEQDVNHLTVQQQALARTLQQFQAKEETEVILKLRAELGEVEKRLTLAKEAFTKAQ